MSRKQSMPDRYVAVRLDEVNDMIESLEVVMSGARNAGRLQRLERVTSMLHRWRLAVEPQTPGEQK